MQDFITSLDMGEASLGILLLGLVLKLTGFAVRDELALRLLVAGGFICDAAFYWFRADPIVPSVLSNIALLTINVILIVAIATERTTWRMSDEDRGIYAQFPTLSPGQFRRLRKMYRTETCAPGTVLTREGQPVDALMLVYAERILISKDDNSFPITGPTFVGEVALLTGRPSSADVSLPDGGRVLFLDAQTLRRRMKRSPPLNNAMVALFGEELARKVADSVPMERAAPPERSPGQGLGG